jgi:hypothetical protein
MKVKAEGESKIVTATGYLHPGYAESLAEFGTPKELSGCKGWILKRRIPDSPFYDGMGCYPIFVCQDWSKLCSDLEEIGNELVSLSVVTDPFGGYDESYLRKCFKDVIVPFKEHFVIDLSRDIKTFVSGHHLRYAHKAIQQVQIEIAQKPEQFATEWFDLYATLINRHNIQGIPAFSKSSFEKQLKVPGIIMFRAIYEEITVGMVLWYIQKDICYYHLGAYSDIGYTLRASFALFRTAIQYFISKGFQWLNLGSGAGIMGNSQDGLSRFKSGWATGTRTAYFCGRIFDRSRYAEIIQGKGICATDYFPAYRIGEFDSARQITIKKDIKQE